MSKNKIHSNSVDDIVSGKMPWLSIKCQTWSRDSYGLFDYWTNKLTDYKATIFDSFHLDRDGDVIS